MPKHQLPLILLAFLLIVLTTACSEDERLVTVAREAADRQAEQNREMADLNRQVVEATGLLVEAEAKAREEVIELQRGIVQRDATCRKELNTLHQELQTAFREERRSLDRQREELEQERAEIAKSRYWDSNLAATIRSIGLPIACMLPLALAAYLLYCLRAEGNDPQLNEVLIRELVSERPVLLPPPRADVAAIEDQRKPRLPSTDQDDDVTN